MTRDGSGQTAGADRHEPPYGGAEMFQRDRVDAPPQRRRVAIIAWGSLPWQPTARGATLATEPVWHLDGPRLPVEFARIAPDGRLTLIVVAGYPDRVTTLWAPSIHDDIHVARHNLAQREGAPEHAFIHGITTDGDVLGAVADDVGSVVHSWLRKTHVDAALWTGFGHANHRWRRSGFEGFSLDAAAGYLTRLRGQSRRAATDYIRNAPPQTDTPFRRLVGVRGLLGDDPE